MTNQADLYHHFNRWQLSRGRDLLALLDIQAGHRVLDVGCGTGEITYDIAKLVTPQREVVGLDPDAERLKIAKENQPDDIKNVTWVHDGIESADELSPNSFDRAFANYSMHWVPNKPAAMTKLHEVLTEQGTFIMNCITERTPIVGELAALVPDFATAFQQYDIIDRKAWDDIFRSTGFAIEGTRTVADCVFEDIDQFLTFWEGTSHGAFTCEMLPADMVANLRKKHPGKIAVFGANTYSVLVRKVS